MPPRGRKRYSPRTRVGLSLAGWLFLGISIFVGAAAGKSQAALVFILFGGMLGALFVSALLAWRMVGAVRVWREMPERAWQNQTLHFSYVLRNVRRRGSCLALHINELAPGGVQSVSGFCVEVPPLASFRAGARFAARRRGRIRLEALRVHTGFPFGLVWARRVVSIPASLVVWPAIGRLKRQLLYRGAVETSAATPSGVSGGQDEFFGLREYRPGDNPRWIHWRRSAARSTPVLREMAQPLPEILWVLVDTRLGDGTPAAHDRRESILRFAATLIDHAMVRGFRVGMAAAYRDRIAVLPPDEGRGQRRCLLDALADVDDNPTRGLAETIHHLGRGTLSRAQVILAAAEDEAVRAAPLHLLRTACRHLTVITGSSLHSVFDDNSLAQPEDAGAA